MKLLNDAVRNITDIIVHDVFSPPAASRIYAYSSVAAYEVLQLNSDPYPSFYNKLNGMPLVQTPADEIDYTMAGVLAMCYTAQIFLPSYKMLNPFIDSIIADYKMKLPEKKFVASQLWGSMTSMKMMSWAGKDGYQEIHAMPRYEYIHEPYAWQPTPPDYADAIEPYWGMLRTFIIDSSVLNQEIIRPVFSTDTSSEFYKDAMLVYETGNRLSEEQKLIARFWDDNPYTTYYSGHLQYARKKISPAGHWMDITRIAVENSGCDLMKAAQAYALVSISIADGFICCWKEKYSANSIRPETYIANYIDPTWRPFLQTPPFPEYPSGHSVISTAAAMVLTDLFGEGFGFTDLIETEFDLPARSFPSFNSAALEVSESRIYAGIHFRPAVRDGYMSGLIIAECVKQKLIVLDN